MDIPFSKGRKRPRSSSIEDNSFLKNVTSTVSGLLPDFVTKWFSNNETNANGSVPKADTTDSSLDDETTGSSLVVSAKRRRLLSPVVFNQSNNINSREININNSDSFGVRTFVTDTDILMRDTNFVSTPNKISENEAFVRKEKGVDNSTFKTQHTVSAIGKSVAAKRKSLFDTHNKSVESIASSVKPLNNAQIDLKQPYFKPVLLASPFYSGMTMYGGASSCYMNAANVKRRKVEVNKQDKNNDTCMMSTSTRRVLDLLEHYSSPLTEAKRIPQYTKSTSEKLNDSGVNTSSRNNYKYRELQVPRFLQVLTITKKSRLTNVTTTARRILASQSSSESTPYPPIKNNQDQEIGRAELTTKMQRKFTRSHRGGVKEFEETVPAIELPSYPLKIDAAKLPTFSLDSSPLSAPITSTPKPFSTLSSSPNSRISTNTTSSITISSVKNDITATKVANEKFTFANPIKITENTSIPQFTYVDSDKQVGNKEKEEVVIEAPLVDKLQSTDGNKVDWECPDCWVKNKFDTEKCVCCGGKPGNKSLKSTHSKFVETQSHSTKMSTSVTMTGTATSSNNLHQLQKSSQWKCQDCWVGNDSEKEKCVCCGASKPKKTSPIVQKANLSMEKEKKGDYSGFINNNVSDRCVPCIDDSKTKSGDGESTLKTTVTSNQPESSISFQGIAKSQKSDTWECHLCLVNNSNKLSRCHCCDMQNLSKAPKVNFKFGMNNTFKFGSALKKEEASMDNDIEVKLIDEEKTKVNNSEANNNNLSDTPSLTFNFPVKKSEEKLESMLAKAEEPKFKFGINQKINTDPVPSDIQKSGKLTELSKAVEIDEKLQEVPTVNLLKPKAPTSQSDSIPSADTLKPLNNYMLSTPEKPSTGFLNTVPATTTATSISFTSIKPVNSETVKAPALIFQNKVTTATTSSTFTFGTNRTQNNASLEKPQFLYNFGNNKGDTPLTFKSMLSSSTGSSANKFNISTGTTAVPNIQQPQNTLDASKSLSHSNMLTTGQNIIGPSGGNGLSTSTVLVGNGFNSGNTLGSNSFGSNLMSGGSSINTSLTLIGTGLNAGNPMGNNTLSVDNNLENNTLNSRNALLSNGLSLDNAPSGGLTTSSTIVSNTISTVGAQTENASNNNNNNNVFANPSSQYTHTATTATPIFGQIVQKENMWSMNNPANSRLGMTTAASKELVPFAFVSTTPLTASNSTPEFANSNQSATNVFGVNQNQSTQNSGTMFSMPARNVPVPNIFGSPLAANNQTSTPSIFGTSNMGVAPTFGTPNASIPSFEAPSLTPAPAPAFNFGGPQTTGIFGFGQQQPNQPTGVYNFGASGNAQPVQFNMGTAPVTTGRRLKKAVRRTNQR